MNSSPGPLSSGREGELKKNIESTGYKLRKCGLMK